MKVTAYYALSMLAPADTGTDPLTEWPGVKSAL